MGEKYALLISIDYINQNNRINCSYKIPNITHFLISKCGYKPQNIKLLTDSKELSRNNIDKISLKNNINNFVQNCKNNDTLFLYYSGHGSLPRDKHRLIDNVMVPPDYDKTLNIERSWLQNMISNKFIGKFLFGFFDCCCTDDIVNLPYILKLNNYYNPKSLQIPLSYNIIGNNHSQQENKQDKRIYNFLEIQDTLKDTLKDTIRDNIKTVGDMIFEVDIILQRALEEVNFENGVLPLEYIDEDWSDSFDIITLDQKNKNNVCIFSSYVDKKYLYGNCYKSHGDITQIFIDFLNNSNNNSVDDRGNLMFKSDIDLIGLSKYIGCNLLIKRSLQNLKIYLGNPDYRNIIFKDIMSNCF